MTENRYKFDTARLINLWLLPTLLAIFWLVGFYMKLGSWENLSLSDILFWTLFFVFAVGVFIFLFLDHLPLAKQTELVIRDKTFKIIQRDESYTVDLTEIKEIVQYSTGRLPWSSIVKWIVKTNDQEFIISSLTISKLNFERHFWNKTKDKVSLFPVL